MPAKVILVTGASSGIGKACAEYLSQRGHRVYRGSRSTQDKPEMLQLALDVDDDESTDSAVQKVVRNEGRLDVVLNCAGFGIVGAVEDTSIAEAKGQFETNFFGVVRVCRAALPAMRQQGSGLIINVSSIAGLVSLPFQAFYSASKFALEGLSEALAMEVAPFGVRVVLVEPGDFRTGFTANRKQTRKSLNDSDYRERYAKALAVFEKEEANSDDPLGVARLVSRIIDNKAPRLRYSVGPTGERIVPGLKHILPQKVYQWLFMKHYDID
ncbi:MAG TPA: SDR family oxidoreductase [Pyrinomonadaceae bacterium]|nr:SDR family oxidoreductase [Pyrinomonadaceae bacterium]